MDIQLESQSSEIIREVLSRKKRFLLFLVTYILGAVVLTGIDKLQNPNSVFPLLSNFVGAIIFLPIGLFEVVVFIIEHTFRISINLSIYSEYGNKINNLGVVISYLLVYWIALAGILTRKIQTFRILYYIFVSLLIISIAGCAEA